MNAPTSTPILAMQGIDKSFPGVQALKNASLTVHAGEVMALLGENGAGKSTLIKILAGAHQPDAGGIHLDGKSVHLPSPLAVKSRGVAVIYQEFNLQPSLSIRENIFLGQEKTRFGMFSKRVEARRTRELLAKLDFHIDPETICRDLTVAQQQIIEIAKALLSEARIIIMDEPSATLTMQEVALLFRMIRELRDQGIAIIYISHRLDEIFEIADRVTVMRDGETVACEQITGITRDHLIELMVGRKIENEFPKAQHPLGDVLFKADSLSAGNGVRDASFVVRNGEVLGITGLVGAGKTELARLLFGADQPDGGSMQLSGDVYAPKHPADAILHGVSLLTEDRKAQGLVLGQSVRENFGLPNLQRWSQAGVINGNAERRALSRYVDGLRIKIPNQEQLAKNLSGGNQQKVVLAKWLEADTQLVIFDEPTRGIDVGAKYEIYLLINQLVERGKAIIMISSELPEVLGMSDRILVMHEGRICAEISDVASATQEQIMHHAVGG